ncbi:MULTISPECIES: hypothetical protein [unclassified Streptomyces]|uniref:hypothetical protein n=1 Tax=unclassified Streptomyces TaxID=2593676 RepID=UPI0033F6381D
MTHQHATPSSTADDVEHGQQVEPAERVDVLLSSYDVRDDGLIPLHLLGPTLGAPAALRTLDPERLRAQLRAHRGVVQWEPGRNLLRLRHGTGRATLIPLDADLPTGRPALPTGQDHRFVG